MLSGLEATVTPLVDLVTTVDPSFPDPGFWDFVGVVGFRDGDPALPLVSLTGDFFI